MALEGTLKDFSLADIFQLIGLQRKTGVLTLRAKDDTVTVTFLDGKVVGADSLSHRLENRLGHVLIRSELLTQDQLNRALEIQKETLQRLGFILVHYGIISVDALKQAIQLQILQIVFRLFRWKDGDYHFSQETTIEYDRDYVVPVSAERIRSYDMVFRKKLTDQEIVVVGAEDADEVDFDSDATPMRRRRQIISDKIRISREEKAIYDMVDGTMSVRDVLEMSKFSEFDTAKALYELLTRDLIEEVRGSAAAAVLAQVTPLDESEVAETPVPLPLVAALALLAIISLATSFRNPLNSLYPLGPAQRASAITETRKAISIERIEQIGEAVEAYSLVNGHLPSQLSDLTPVYISPSLLHDPWGHTFKYIPKAQRYLVIGFTPDEKPDTDLLLSHLIDSGAPTAATSKPVTGGIQLLD